MEEQIQNILNKSQEQQKVMTGMRPTGKMHLGHLVAVLKPYLELQELSALEDNLANPSFMIADIHSITTRNTKDDFKTAESRMLEFTKDLIASGVDPNKSIIYAQSTVPEHLEIGYLLSNLVSVGRLERNPTYKDWIQKLKSPTASLFLYPVLQAGDILANDGTIIPVGQDQLPHLEISREIARKVNDMAGYELFRVPNGLEMLNEVMLGTDGQKMGKSAGNTIDLGESDKSYQKKIRKMVTDPEKTESNSYVGHPEICSVYTYHRFFSQDLSRIKEECKQGSLLCGNCKKGLEATIAPYIESFRDRRANLSDDVVYDVLREGQKKTQEIASEKLDGLKSMMGIKYHF